MAQFRVEFILDQASGKYFAELYTPTTHDELLVRTEALYPTQAAAVLGVVQLFKNAILQFPAGGRRHGDRQAKKKTGSQEGTKKAKAKAKQSQDEALEEAK